MSVGYLGFVLLLWFPGVLHDEKACVPLTIPNGNYDASTDGWYEERDKIWVRCDEGYEHKDRDATAECIDGAWDSVPICERSTESCGDPPKIPHAVIIGKGYQEMFTASSKLQYKCEDGYTAEGADTETIICISGNWTEGPTCKVGTGGRHTTSAGSGIQPAGGDRRLDTGHGGSTVGGSGGGDTTSAGSGIQPAGGDRRLDTGHGGSTVGGTGGGDTTSAGSGIQPAGGDRIPDTGHGGSTVGGTGGGDTTSAGSGRQPAGGGSSTGHGGGTVGGTGCRNSDHRN
ncbi:hypothetical protein JOQ06_001597, partial [Pogonophryne albipinna]